MKRVAQKAKAQASRIWRIAERHRNAGGSGGVVLIYHRIARPPADPWGMAVGPEAFADHMAILRRFGVPRKFGDFADRLNSKVSEPGVVVTFDDGYVDNLLALPILEAHDVPATIFIASGAVGRPEAFWWDLLTRIFLQTPTLPQHLTLAAGKQPLTCDLEADATCDDAALLRASRWRPDVEGPQDARQRAFLKVWQHLIGLAPDEITTAARDLGIWAGVSADKPLENGSRPVTPTELQVLADSPLIEIGGHTRTHADLSRLSRAQAAQEISGGRHDLIRMTGREVRSFAYPYGRSGPHTIADIRDAGFSCAGCSRPGLATRRHAVHALPRVHATDLSAEEFEALLWCYMVPRRRAGPRP